MFFFHALFLFLGFQMKLVETMFITSLINTAIPSIKKYSYTYLFFIIDFLTMSIVVRSELIDLFVFSIILLMKKCMELFILVIL
jgi:hypothetical protein